MAAVEEIESRSRGGRWMGDGRMKWREESVGEG
jgi:hypothetical protein